jgi:hypothetical protein
MTFGSFVNHEKVQPLVENKEVVTNILGMLGGDFKDLKLYLETGTSPKYDDEKILGHWAFNFNASMNAARRKKPTMGSLEIRKLRTTLGAIFVKSMLTATIDRKAILKIPSISGSKGTVRGSWKNTDGKYSLGISEDGKKLELEAEVDGRHLIFTKDGFVLVFENTRV